MFNKLVASQGKRRMNPTTIMTSIVIHALLLAGAVYASVHAPQSVKKRAEELVTFMDVKEPEPPKPEAPPPPPPPEPEKPKPVAPPPPKGFQELIPPKEPPPAIPDVDLSAPAVDPKDFTGIGAAGGTANGVEGGTPTAEPVDSSNFAYEVAVLERKPELKNKSQVASMLSRYYPRMLQDAGIGGQTVMQFVIEKDGTVDPTTVKVVSTSHEQFADASSKVVEKFRFSPGRYKGQPVRVLIQMPITWQPQG
jgi:protein TonB